MTDKDKVKTSKTEINKLKTIICNQIKDLSIEEIKDIGQFFANSGRLNELHEGNGGLSVDLNKLKNNPTDEGFKGESETDDEFIIKLHRLFEHKIKKPN